MPAVAARINQSYNRTVSDTPETRENDIYIRFLEDILYEAGVEDETGGICADVSGSGYSAALELHPYESKIYIWGKHDGGTEFEAWISTVDGNCSENFDAVLKLVFP